MKTKIYNILTIILLICVTIQAPVLYYYINGLFAMFIMIPYLIFGLGLTYFMLIVVLSGHNNAKTKFHIIGLTLTILIGMLTLFFGPDLIEKVDWYLRKDTRKEIVYKVMSGELTPNMVDSNYGCKLDSWKFPPISNGGNIISIDKTPDNKYKIKFYINNGFLDHYSAFVYTNDPKEIKELDERTLSPLNMDTNKKLEENWYRVSY